MFEKTSVESTRQMRRLLSAAAGMTLLLVSGAACGSGSPGESPANAAAAAPGTKGIASRTNPSPEQVATAITQVKERIKLSFQPSDGHVRAFGDAACAAFDEGKTAPQVRGMLLAAASQLPSITVTPADADFAIGKAVSLFCPGYSVRLGS